MHEEDQAWMDYVDGEVRAVCEVRGWGHQIRRKAPARSKFVGDSPLDDYEWKLIPGAKGKLPDARWSTDFDGDYYVLSCDRRNDRFLLQHDTNHCGLFGPHWEEETYTQIGIRPGSNRTPFGLPEVGWLHDHLLALTNRFRPNSFSVT